MAVSVDPTAAADMARGESRERLVEIGHNLPADMGDISRVSPEAMARELTRLTHLLSCEYKSVEEAKFDEDEAGQMKLMVGETKSSDRPKKQAPKKPARPPRGKLKTARQRAQADTRPDLKPFPYGTDDAF